jgi:hypothetical protein
VTEINFLVVRPSRVGANEGMGLIDHRHGSWTPYVCQMLVSDLTDPASGSKNHPCFSVVAAPQVSTRQPESAC